MAPATCPKSRSQGVLPGGGDNGVAILGLRELQVAGESGGL